MGLNSRYEIRVKGILDGRWAAWFEDLQVSSDGEESVISGTVADQAALHGLLQGTRPRAVPDLGTPPRSRLTFAPSSAQLSGREAPEELAHPIMLRTPMKNTDQAPEKSEKGPATCRQPGSIQNWKHSSRCSPRPIWTTRSPRARTSPSWPPRRRSQTPREWK